MVYYIYYYISWNILENKEEQIIEGTRTLLIISKNCSSQSTLNTVKLTLNTAKLTLIR